MHKGQGRERAERLEALGGCGDRSWNLEIPHPLWDAWKMSQLSMQRHDRHSSCARGAVFQSTSHEVSECLAAHLAVQLRCQEGVGILPGHGQRRNAGSRRANRSCRRRGARLTFTLEATPAGGQPSHTSWSFGQHDIPGLERPAKGASPARSQPNIHGRQQASREHEYLGHGARPSCSCRTKTRIGRVVSLPIPSPAP